MREQTNDAFGSIVLTDLESNEEKYSLALRVKTKIPYLIIQGLMIKR
jgi:hypothetical protein